MTGRRDERVWVLAGYDPDTGCATRPVAVAGAAGDTVVISWVPLEHVAAERWRQVLARSNAELAATLGHWMVAGDGVTLDVVELETAAVPAAGDLRGTVEMVMDRLLVEGFVGGCE
jgi:hypothetical protein